MNGDRALPRSLTQAIPLAPMATALLAATAVVPAVNAISAPIPPQRRHGVAEHSQGGVARSWPHVLR